ncbi:MAG: prolipoprotein diacylglyceryl transferase [Clostridia bacterium]|nr:prolipoprotein diacylglyceryl transferase [Clostridia bacterium]
MNKISFPGLGIGEMEIDPVALRFGEVSIAWYGLIITCGILLSALYISLRGKRLKLVTDDLIDVAFCTVIPGIIGARLYYVFFDFLDRPNNYTSFYDVIAVWEGGLAIYGGIIGGALGALIGLRWKKIRIPAFFDLLAPAVQIAQSLGRWGNFCNAEAYGSETTLPWRMRIVNDYHPTGIEVHPTFLYESLWNLIGFILLNLYSKKKKFDGEIFFLYLGWYGLGRMFIEGLRTDSLYLGGLRVSQWLAGACLVVAVGMLIYLHLIKKLRTVADCIYLPESKRYNEVMQVEPTPVAPNPGVSAFPKQDDGSAHDPDDSNNESSSQSNDPPKENE